MTDHDAAWGSLGTWVRRRRKALDLTQAALARRVGCAEITIQKIETDARRPSRAMAERLACCLELSPEEQTVMLQVASGERGLAGLPTRRTGIDLAPPSGGPPPVRRLPDTVPPPAMLPPGSHMPLRRNPLFVGREQDLRALAQALNADGTAAIGQVEIVAATGLGGIGKTQLACEFVHRYGPYFPGGVFWLSFADPATIPAEVAACGGLDGMQISPAFDTLPLEQQVRQVLAAWKEPLPRLLIFDNCEEETLLEQWRPKHGGCRVLVTSRHYHWDVALGVQAVPLDVLPRSDSIALLRQFRSELHEDDADLAAVAAALGDLPLAIHLAGSFLAHYRHALTPAQYLSRLHTPTLLDDRSLQAAGLSPTQHVQHVARTFEQSYERLDAAVPTDALALTLLAHAAYFAPGESLPRWLLLQTLNLPEEDAERTLLGEDALMRLIDLGLLDTAAAGSLRLHRLVVAFVRAVLGNAAVQEVVEGTVLRVVDDLNARRNPCPVLAIQPHLRAITEAAQVRADTRTAAFCTALGAHLWQLGVYGEAQRYHAQALAIRRRVLGADHPDTAQSLNNLGNVRWKQGQYAEARRYHAQALAIRQRVLGSDHRDTAQSLNNLGLMLQELGHYAEAQRSYEQAFAINQRVLGPDHPNTALILNNLGFVFDSQGQYAAAQRSYEQALAIWQRVLGDDHPDTALSLWNLGEVFTVQGQYAEAQRALEQALKIYRRVLGSDHPHTARCLRAWGKLLHAQRETEQAQSYLVQALAIQQRMLGDDHPDTAQTFNNLGLVLQAQGHYTEAQGYYEQALAIDQHVLGLGHPETALSLNNLAGVLQAQGQYAEAQRSYEQALDICQRVLGSDHITTHTVHQNLVCLIGLNPTITQPATK